MLELLEKKNLVFWGERMAQRFFILLVETGKEVFVLHAVEKNVLHLQEQLTPAILSLHDSHSRCTAANKKRA